MYFMNQAKCDVLFHCSPKPETLGDVRVNHSGSRRLKASAVGLAIQHASPPRIQPPAHVESGSLVLSQAISDGRANVRQIWPLRSRTIMTSGSIKNTPGH